MRKMSGIIAGKAWYTWLMLTSALRIPKGVIFVLKRAFFILKKS
jgi:hypothetical protein